MEEHCTYVVHVEKQAGTEQSERKLTLLRNRGRRMLGDTKLDALNTFLVYINMQMKKHSNTSKAFKTQTW
ncbi:hypothetical protein QVD17_11500 [Tagetes erecta]|uniref:Uncharacterized protein n=1 Tax=Tagetes erecta TaxID=13708 RepID=A0AAD8KVA4_TARER|nr:hypothetical protein QVD17_11500 [Tagetes erecta]